MNNVGKLVKQYNRFVSDLNNMNSIIYELLTDNFKLDFIKENWSPRSTWTSRERYSGWYTTEKIIFYVCYNLKTDQPYLQLLKCDVNLENTSPEDFGENDGFDHIENEEIKKKKVSNIFSSFEQDWGKCYYCKIDLTSIDSDETVNRDIKSVLECLLKNKYSNNEFNKLLFL